MKEKHTRIGNMAITAAILAATSGLSYLLHRVSNSDFHVPMLFVLAVLFISLLTDGYVYGIIASMAAVIGVNYIFTYPYFALNFTITGYPMTFLTMLAVSICVSALTTRIKKQEQIRLEVEKEKTRANLLRAISHDIRTPLTSIVGSASGILENQKVLTQEREMELVQDIKDEAQWLIRIVENLLSVTRINGENARINTEDEVVEEIISSAVIKFNKRFGGSEDAGRISYGSHGRCSDRTGAGESSGKCSAPWEDIYKDLDCSDTHAGAGGDRCGGRWTGNQGVSAAGHV